MSQKFSQDPMKTKELYDYLQFFFTKEVKDDKHAKRINMLAKRTVTLSDVVVIVKALTEHQDNALVQLMDKVQVQERVLKQLNATDEHFTKAQEEYLAALKEREEAFKAQMNVAEQAGKAHAVTLTDSVEMSE